MLASVILSPGETSARTAGAPNSPMTAAAATAHQRLGFLAMFPSPCMAVSEPRSNGADPGSLSRPLHRPSARGQRLHVADGTGRGIGGHRRVRERLRDELLVVAQR